MMVLYERMFHATVIAYEQATAKWSLMNSHHDIGNVRETNEISMNGVIAE